MKIVMLGTYLLLHTKNETSAIFKNSLATSQKPELPLEFMDQEQ